MPKQSSIRSELADGLFRMRRSFYSLAGFSGVINVMMLTPSVYMLQVYDRALVSRNVTTLAMLTVLVVGLFLLMSTLEMVRTRVLIRVGNCLDMDLNRRKLGAGTITDIDESAARRDLAEEEVKRARASHRPLANTGFHCWLHRG
jgi:ATP-binding cassette subfamily C exporter for protease/lipase